MADIESSLNGAASCDQLENGKMMRAIKAKNREAMVKQMQRKNQPFLRRGQSPKKGNLE
jgi:hypothetical protein